MNELESGAGFFPLPQLSPPYRPSSRSRRVWQRYHRSSMVTTVANNTILSLNQLSKSFWSPSLAPSVLYQTRNLPVCHVSSRQLRCVAHIYRCAKRFVSRRSVECNSPVLSDDTEFNLYNFSLYTTSFQYTALPAAAIPIKAELISLPSSPGSIDLITLMPETLKTFYANEQNLLRPTSEVRPIRPSILCASMDDYVHTIKKLSQLGMIEFCEHPKVVNGIFGVPKGEQIRLIIDARPANAVFVDSPHVELPTPDILADLQIHQHQPLFVAKVDLDNFYHRLRLPTWLRPYFALPPIAKSQVGIGNSDELIYPCCTTLPMGWAHSVYIAQAIHENILNHSPHFPLVDRLNRHNDLVIDRVRHQVYIDDLNIFGSDRDEVRKAQLDYIKQVTKLGFVVKESKVVLPSQHGVECVGVEVNGITKECGVSVPKLWKLCAETMQFLSLDTATGLQLSRLVGKWSWAILVNRPAFSVFSAVYRFIQCAGPRKFTIWATVRRELSCAVGLASLLFCNISQSFFNKIIATDASSQGQGVVATSNTIQNFCASNVSDFVQNSRWSTIISSKWRSAEHINILELRAVISAIRWALSYPSSMGCRVLVLSDSAVAVGALSKGRSSSPQLLSRLRSVASLLLCSGIRLTVSWIPTELNPADEPSRKFE